MYKLLMPALCAWALVPCAQALAQTATFYDPYSWGTNFQAWCRFKCDERIKPGQSVVLRFSDIVTDLEMFGNSRTVRGVDPGTGYLVVTKYDMWPDRGYCMFQFRVQYPGSQLTGECSMDSHIVAPTTPTPTWLFPTSKHKSPLFGLRHTAKYPALPLPLPPTTEHPRVFQLSPTLPFHVTPNTKPLHSLFPLEAWKNHSNYTLTNAIPDTRTSHSTFPLDTWKTNSNQSKSLVIPNAKRSFSLNTWKNKLYNAPVDVIPNTKTSHSSFQLSPRKHNPSTFEVTTNKRWRHSSFPLAPWKNEPNHSVWRFHGRCTLVCQGAYTPGTLKVKVNVDKTTANFKVYGKYKPLDPTTGVYRTWTVVNKSFVRPKYSLCQFDFTLDHFPQHPIPTGTCHQMD